MSTTSNNRTRQKRVRRMERRDTFTSRRSVNELIREIISSYGNLEARVNDTINWYGKKEYALSSAMIAKLVQMSYFEVYNEKDLPPAWLIRKLIKYPTHKLTNSGWRTNDEYST